MKRLTKEIQNSITEKLDRVGYPLQDQLYDTEVEDFFIWFFENAYVFDVSSTLDEAILNDRKIIESRCFGNSQYIANKYRKGYLEGFILYSTYDIYIPHGFNMHDEKVEDYTLAPNDLSSEYYGIIIPIDFVLKYNGKDIDSPSANASLLVEYYREQTKLLAEEED
ncbi:hypothetical protein [Bacteroides graminisolvens]|uniref:hypothetical protein n=1 Tax=Bacteroides graminisolvens TaxID=477666 RepID=UPI0029C79E39|nr:hypothetical protein [Bacteroides graminisolvens]